MNQLALSEYNPESVTECRLQVLIRLPDILAARALQHSLSDIAGGDIGIHPEPGQCLLTVPAGPLADPDRFLLDASAALDIFNRNNREKTNAELVEARMINSIPVDGFTPDTRISKNFQVAVDPGPDVEVDDRTIVLSHGRVFGTGTHPSTRLAIRAMEELAAELTFYPRNVLDVGCGSGLLAMLSARLGAEKVTGVDICPEAISIARRNIEQNRLTAKIKITDTPVAALKGRFNLIIANLTPSTLFKMLGNLVGLLRDKSFLIISGIQGQQADHLIDRMSGLGINDCKFYREGRWRALRLGYNTDS